MRLKDELRQAQQRRCKKPAIERTRNFLCFHTRIGDLIELWSGWRSRAFRNRKWMLTVVSAVQHESSLKNWNSWNFPVCIHFLHSGSPAHVLMAETVQWNLKINWNVLEIDKKSNRACRALPGSRQTFATSSEVLDWFSTLRASSLVPYHQQLYCP